MKKPDKFSIGTRGKSFSFALNGILKLMKSEHNARIHLAALICAVVLGVLLKIDLTGWIIIFIVSGQVFICELFNTAIEKMADVAEPKWNIDIGLIKDFSSGAVLISAIVALLTGAMIFIPRIIEIFN